MIKQNYYKNARLTPILLAHIYLYIRNEFTYIFVTLLINKQSFFLRCAMARKI